MYNFNFCKLDTASNTSQVITNASQVFVSNGKLTNRSVYTTTTKPFLSELNLIPTSKGLYYVDFRLQETMFHFNNNAYAVLRVNIDNPNKHLYFFEPYIPGITVSNLLYYENEGFAYYVFRVI